MFKRRSEANSKGRKKRAFPSKLNDLALKFIKLKKCRMSSSSNILLELVI